MRLRPMTQPVGPELSHGVAAVHRSLESVEREGERATDLLRRSAHMAGKGRGRKLLGTCKSDRQAPHAKTITRSARPCDLPDATTTAGVPLSVSGGRTAPTGMRSSDRAVRFEVLESLVLKIPCGLRSKYDGLREIPKRCLGQVGEALIADSSGPGTAFVAEASHEGDLMPGHLLQR